MALGLTQPLTDMILGVNALPACKADKLTAIYEPIVQKVCGPLRPVTGIALFFTLVRQMQALTFSCTDSGTRWRTIIRFMTDLITLIYTLDLAAVFFLTRG
jgi:hypothetical protein